MRERPLIGRRLIGPLGWGPRTFLEPGGSMLVVGPTQAGKTSSLVVPAILNWPDAVVVTSVKNDVVATTAPWRRGVGRVSVLEPGRDNGATWNPLEGVTSLRHALRVAGDLTLPTGGRGDGEFWNSLATKTVAGLMMVALERGGSIFDVAAAVQSRRLEGWVDAGLAGQLVASSLLYDPRTLDSVLTTAETMLYPWRFVQPLAKVREVVDGPHTLYLCAPRAEQRHYEPLFRGALRMVLEEQQRRAEDGRARRLLVVLDEAATVAALDELDQLAATVAGFGVTLITVVQDFAQLRARWGERAATIVNNHRTRVVLAGLADPTVATYLPELNGEGESSRVAPLRTAARGTAHVVSGREAAYRVRLRPWWRWARLRHRGARGK